MSNKRVDLEPVGSFLDEPGLIAYRMLQPALVDDILTYAVNRTTVILATLGVKTDDVEYYRAHALAALYAAADGLPGELCDSRAASYKRNPRRIRANNPTSDARAMYFRMVEGKR